MVCVAVNGVVWLTAWKSTVEVESTTGPGGVGVGDGAVEGAEDGADDGADEGVAVVVDCGAGVLLLPPPPHPASTAARAAPTNQTFID